MKGSAKEILKPTLILFVICFIMTALLAGTNMLTKDQILQQEQLAASNARLTVMPGAKDFTDKDGYYEAVDGANLIGYVFTTSSKHGYGGEIKVMTGITTDGQISGVVLLSINETPGLGMNAQKDSFRAQYRQSAPGSGFTVIKSGTPEDGEIEALTGATITSKAVTEAVNEAVVKFNEVQGVK